MTTNLLVAGPPRCGKSTLIERLIKQLEGPLTGFFTREIREKGKRVGFKIVTLDGLEGVLAHERIKSPVRIGKYGVDLQELEKIAVPAIQPTTLDQVVIIDEIGKMECFSQLFQKQLTAVLESRNIVLGSIALKGTSFIERIKARNDVRIFQVTDENRDELVMLLMEELANLRSGLARVE
jgi:nucleoside-triphosphatase THEP1